MPEFSPRLHALAICYRILGSVVAVGISLFVILIVAAQPGNMVIGLPLLLVFGTMVYLWFEVAGALEDCERRTFCMVIAWLTCALFPLGTVLGVFTILQLVQPEAERAFDDARVPFVKAQDLRVQAED